MPIHLSLPPTMAEAIDAASRPLVGSWVVSGSPVAAEITAGSGLDLILVDGEHSANTLETIQTQLQVIAAYPAIPLVRVPYGDAALIKQYLDLGVQNLLVPMVDTAEHAEEVVRAVHYPPRGVRGVGSALARAARWNRVDGYLARASETVSLTVQIETATAISNVEDILRVDGVDTIFVGPSDLAASMGLLGQQDHPDVIAAVELAIAAAHSVGKPVGVNAFAPATADRYLDGGADYVFVGADVALLARGTEALADRFIVGRGGSLPGSAAPRASY